jgi:HEAT repeat protein
VSTGTRKTLKLLTDTANEAAVPVLLAALDSADRDIQQGALTAILGRRRGAGAKALVKRWGRLRARWKQQIANHPRQIAPAVRDAILSREGELCANGCEALLSIREFELIPALVTGIEEPGSPFATMLSETLIGLCELLQEEISGPRDKLRLREPSRVRQQVLPSLERAVDHFEQHRRREVVEAFLMLTNCENALLKQILCEPRHPAYLVVTDILRNTSRVAVMRLVLNLLESRSAPSFALHLVSHRSDLPFIKQLLCRLANSTNGKLRASLRRVESIGWLEDDLSILDALSEKEQEMAVQLAITTNMDRIAAFDAIAHMMRLGRVGGRRAAALALAEFGGAEANQLVLDGLHDADPQVQANVVIQLRERGIPGAISRLIQLLDSPHKVVADAAQSCLSEFNFPRYLTVFDMMEDDVRRSTGLLVMRIDTTAVTQLAEELKARTRTRRLRGLEVAMAMDAVHEVEPLIIGMLKDDDHFVRAEAARTLAYCHSPLAQQSLRESLMDRSVVVREAAEQSLRKLSEAGRVTTAGSFASALERAEASPLMNDQES